MFGYILPDKPNLYMKDYALYRAFYCGLCHQIGRCQGQCMRLAVNYDVTFVSILMHGLKYKELPFEKKACILNPFKKKVVLQETDTQKQMAHLNALLIDFKCRDDIADGKKGRRALRSLIKGKVKKSRAALPEVADVLDRAYREQCAVEAAKTKMWQMAADPFGEAMRRIVQILSGDASSAEVGMIGYHLGQYVYLMDAIDDYDKDLKKDQYNPLRLTFLCHSKAELIARYGEELNRDLAQLVAMVKDNYQRIPIFSTEGIVTNTLWMGLNARYREVIKENGKCLKTHTKF